MRYVIIFFSVILLCNKSLSQIAIQKKGEINFQLLYGRDIPLVNGRDIDVTSYFNSRPIASNFHPYKKIQIISNWYTLFDDLIYNNGVVWALNDNFTFKYPKDGKQYSIDKARLAKYPDLIKRLKNARPIDWSMSITFDATITIEGWKNSLCKLTLKISDNDIIISQEGEKPLMVGGSPKNYSDRVAVDIEDFRVRRDAGDLKKIWKNITGLKFVSVNDLLFQNPIEEWYQILQLYDVYEKEKVITLSDEIKNEMGSTAVYDKTDDWSIPFEDDFSEAVVEYSETRKSFVLKKGEKIIKEFSSKEYFSIEKDKGLNIIIARLNDYSSINVYQLMDNKGNVMQIDGQTTFNYIIIKDNTIECIITYPGILFSKKEDTHAQPGLYPSLSAATNAFEEGVESYKAALKRQYSSSSSNGVIIAMQARTYKIVNAKKIITNTDLNILRSESGVLMYTY